MFLSFMLEMFIVLHNKNRLYLTLIVFLLINQFVTYFVIKATIPTLQIKSSLSIPLSKANQSDAVIAVWANTAAVDIFTYNYRNITPRFDVISKYFTTSQWQSYLQQSKQSGTITKVKKEKMLVGAVATNPVRIINKKIVAGRYQWTAIVPLQVDYSADNKEAKQYLQIEMDIVRQSKYSGVSGLAINRFIATPKKNTIEPK